MRRIRRGTAYDTETAELIKEAGFNDAFPDQGERLYRTRNGAFFVWGQYIAFGNQAVEEIEPCTEEKAQEWLEKYGNELVEKYFGEMPEGGAAERRMTLRLPSNLADRLEAIAQDRGVPLSRYLRQRLEKCTSEDGKPAVPV